MIIITIEGCHGAGKTELCKQLKNVGFDVLDEAFIDMPSYAIHPQSLMMESVWLSNWFTRLLQRSHEMTPEQRSRTIYIADRSPYSAEFYANKGHLLQPLITEQIKELREQADIHIYTVYVRVEKELLWGRILQRLQREPHRAKYNEGSRAWLEQAYSFYDSHRWDFVVDNNSAIAEVSRTLLQLLYAKVDRFPEHVPTPISDVHMAPAVPVSV
eukprot:gnl/Trimastix_PCT/4172.p2 GENE.gnl/Trimastix_PCT/4172~~gnl/Trimastix_PCT/4172.p2  ORF type:complete len:214 (+),score=77.33 gnl/Trimastix_PCT/4172:64-705(+)